MSERTSRTFLTNFAKNLSSLYEAVKDSYVEGELDFEKLLDAGFHSRQGLFFQNSMNLRAEQMKFAVGVSKFFSDRNLGVKESMSMPLDAFALCLERSEISELAFKLSLDSVIEDALAELYQIIVRTNLFSLDEGIEGLHSDRVSILRAERAVANIPFPLDGKNWRIIASNHSRSEESDFIFDEGIFKVSVSGTCWYIKSNFTKENLFEESRWVANIFVSFYRLFIAYGQKGYFPRIGDVEAEPFFASKGRYSGVAFNNERWRSLEIKNHLPYQITQECCNDFSKLETQDVIDNILLCSDRSTGQRVRDGLCWLSRARQSSDFSERLLYNFTAMEALLMTNSKLGAPVVETICRFCSIICAKEVKHRKKIYKEIKNLYAIRSELVHKGKRGANLLDSNSLQSIAELIYSVVLKECDLKMKHDDFIASLSDASHGTDWHVVD